MLPKYTQELQCSLCGVSYTTRKYNGAQTCSSRCGGLRQRKLSEAKLKLDAFDVWTPDMAYALGLIFSDGNLHQPKKGSWRIQFVSTDLEQAQWFHSFVGNPHPLFCKKPKQRRVCGLRLKRIPKPQYVSVTVSDTLVQRLQTLGVRPCKSKLGTAMSSPPERMIGDFLRGVCDGDGAVMLIKNRKMPSGVTLRVVISCFPLRDRLFLSQLLESLGIPHSMNSKELRMGGSQAEHFCKKVYEAPHATKLIRKHQVWVDWCALRTEVGGLISERDAYAPLRGVQPRPWHALFGKNTDREIAKQAHVSIGAVARSRSLLGFSPVPPLSVITSRPWHRFVGTMPDSHIAVQFEISPPTVLTYRRKIGLPSYSGSLARQKKSKPCKMEDALHGGKDSFCQPQGAFEL